MITKVSLEHSSDRGHRKADKRALMRIEAPAGFDQSGARDLQEVFLVLAAMQEPARQRLRQPEMRRDHFIEDLLAFGRPRSLCLNEEVLRTFGKLFAQDLGRRKDGSFGDRHERDTLRQVLRRGALLGHIRWKHQSHFVGNPFTIQKTKKSLRNQPRATLDFGLHLVLVIR